MKYFDIYKEMMDSLHFYILHLITSGLRMSGKQDLNENDEDGEDDYSPYFDRAFSRISKFIANSKEKTNRFTRLSGMLIIHFRFNISTLIVKIKIVIH